MIRGRQRDLRQAWEAKWETSLHNRFEIEVVDGATGAVKQRARAENVICDQLWSRLLTPNSYFNYIQYGTGEGTPSSTDTKLFAFSGYLALSGDTCELNLPGHWYSLRRRGQLAENVAVGQTLTEVGIAYGTGSNTLCTHAMLRDMNGNQISIQKTDTDVINIYATVFVHWPDSLVTGGVQILPYAYTDRGFLAYLAGRYLEGSHYAAYFAAKPPCFAVLSRLREFGATSEGNKANSHREFTTTFNTAARTITLTLSRIPVDCGNWPGGARGVMLFLRLYSGSSSKYPAEPAFYLEVGKSDWFPGSTIKGEAVGSGDGSTVDFATAFDDPESATIYVDGAPVSGVSVQNATVQVSNMGIFFDRVKIDGGIAFPDTNKTYTGLNSLKEGTYFNPYWAYGIDSFRVGKDISSIRVSDDLVNWRHIVDPASPVVPPGNGSVICSVPESLQRKKYWEITGESNGFDIVDSMTSPTLTGKNIHFTTPPPAGAVITADYFTKRIAKDSNHVFDLTLTIQLGERTI